MSEDQIPEDIKAWAESPKSEGVLDGLVHDAVSQTASNINNEGTLSQIRFLREEGFSWKYIREAMEETTREGSNAEASS